MSDPEVSIMSDPQAGAFEEALHRLLSASARELVRDAAPGRFLEWIVREGPVLGAGLMPADAHPLMPQTQQLMRLFGHMAYAMLPLPQHQFLPREIGLPARDEPCLCGSLHKFNQCCEPMLASLPRLPPEMGVSHVLDAMGRAAWADLPARQVSPKLIEAAGDVFKHARRLKDGLALLEPWAAQPGRYPDDWAALLDLLGDLYADLGKPRKRRSLALAMIERGEPLVQSKGWQRLCLMATDADRRADADQAYMQAQRLAPDDPALSLLELSMLLGFGETVQAARRAQFHIRRLDRRNVDGRFDHLIAGVRAMGERGQGFVEDVSLAHEPELARLDAWASALAAPQLRLRLGGCTPADLGALHVDEMLAEPLQRWTQGLEPGPPWGGFARWMSALEGAPALGDSFEVLDALLVALQSHPSPGAPAVARRLSARALGLWAALRERFPQAACRWALAPNRPALRVLTQHIVADTTPRADHSFEWLRHLVEVLNPEDPHRLRTRLAAVYLRRGLGPDALALGDRHPQDLDEMRLARVLALWQTGQRGDATALLAQTLRRNPKLGRVMRAARRPQPRRDEPALLGSLLEAQLALAEQWDLWQDAELRDMLMSVLRRSSSRA